MNINPSAKRILCFGDSNTHGTILYQPGSSDKGRYNPPQRRTGILQETLGNDYEIIEEGRGGRTINTPGDGDEPTKLGSLFLEGLLHTHGPVDLVVVMLGTNDIKDCFGLDTKSISSQMEEKIIKLVQRFGCKLLIISPPAIIDGLSANFPTGSNSKIQELNKYYQKLCQKYSVDYVDIQDKLICGSDGIHLTLESHQLLGKTLAQKIKEIL